MTPAATTSAIMMHAAAIPIRKEFLGVPSPDLVVVYVGVGISGHGAIRVKHTSAYACIIIHFNTQSMFIYIYSAYTHPWCCTLSTVVH